MANLKDLLVNGVTKILGKLMLGNAPVHGDGTLVLNSSNYTNYYDATGKKLINIPRNTRLIASDGLSAGTLIEVSNIEIVGMTHGFDSEFNGMRISLLNHKSDSGFTLRPAGSSSGYLYAPVNYAQEASGLIKCDRAIEYIFWGYAWYPTANY